jgi:hypothetical protein
MTSVSMKSSKSLLSLGPTLPFSFVLRILHQVEDDAGDGLTRYLCTATGWYL